MDARDDFDIFVGGKSGVFKGIKLGGKEKKENVMRNLQSLVSITKDDEVTTMSWADDNEKNVLIGCGAKNVRSVKVYDTESSSFSCSFCCDVGEGRINGISQYNGAILTAVHSGEINLWRFEENNTTLLNAGKNLNRMCHSKIDKNIIATGGQEHNLKLFDLETQKQTFTEKNVPPDWLQLRVPIWISDINFLLGSQNVVTVGRYGHVRLYDPKVQRRPVINLEVKDEALFALALTQREKQIIVGSGKGKMNLIDLRKPGRVLNTYKGFVGGVTGIACSSSQPYVISVSLDRYLRIHHIDKKELVKKVYLTSKITSMVLRSGFSLETEDKSANDSSQKRVFTVQENVDNKNEQDSPQSEASDGEYDMLFDQMPVISNKEDKQLIGQKRRKVTAVSS